MATAHQARARLRDVVAEVAGKAPDDDQLDVLAGPLGPEALAAAARLTAVVATRSLRLSTAHLLGHERALLTVLGTPRAGPCHGELAPATNDPDLPRVAAHPYGVVVWVGGHGDPDQLATTLARMAQLHLDGLAAVYRLALACGAALVDLDDDAGCCPDLALYGW